MGAIVARQKQAGNTACASIDQLGTTGVVRISSLGWQLYCHPGATVQLSPQRVNSRQRELAVVSGRVPNRRLPPTAILDNRQFHVKRPITPEFPVSCETPNFNPAAGAAIQRKKSITTTGHATSKAAPPPRNVTPSQCSQSRRFLRSASTTTKNARTEKMGAENCMT